MPSHSNTKRIIIVRHNTTDETIHGIADCERLLPVQQTELAFRDAFLQRRRAEEATERKGVRKVRRKRKVEKGSIINGGGLNVGMVVYG